MGKARRPACGGYQEEPTTGFRVLENALTSQHHLFFDVGGGFLVVDQGENLRRQGALAVDESGPMLIVLREGHFLPGHGLEFQHF